VPKQKSKKMNTTLDTTTEHQVFATIAPAMPPNGTIVLDTTNAVAPLLPPLPNANASIVTMAPMKMMEHNESLADAVLSKTLADYAKDILEAHQNVDRAEALSKRHGKDAIAAAVKAGQYLNEAKALVGHGNWLGWLKANCKGIGKTLTMKSALPHLFADFMAATAFCGLGVPSFTPLFFAAANPNRVRSEINSRSRCATSARIPTVNRSAFGQSQQTKSTPLFWRRKRNSALRASLSSLAMTNVALFLLQ
jgi:Protein of unknown function (DUF3102)